MPILSGPTRERRMRAWLGFILCLAAAGWFAYDGWISWPRANQQFMTNGLSPETQRDLRESEQVNEKMNGRTFDDVQRMLNAQPVGAANDLRFYGRSGYLSFPPDADTNRTAA